MKERWSQVAAKLTSGGFPAEESWWVGALWLVLRGIALLLVPVVILAAAAANRLDRVLDRRPNHLRGGSLIRASRVMLRIAERLHEGKVGLEAALNRITRAERWAKRHERGARESELALSRFGRETALRVLRLERQRRFCQPGA